MHGTWVRFVQGAGWPAYESSARTTMVFGEHSQVTEDQRGDERAFWAGRR